MPFTPELSRKLHQTLGAEAAADIMTWMHDMDAQRGEHREALRADIAEVRQEMHARLTQVREEMAAGLTQVREEMHAGFAGSDAKLAAFHEGMRVGFSHLETRLERRFGDLIKWSFVFWCGAVGSVALLAKALG